MSAAVEIRIPEQLLDSLVSEVCSRHPRNSFGFLISNIDPLTPTDFLLFEDNVRNDREWRWRFEAYGDFYVAHSDAGFVASPEEAWQRQKEIWARDMFEVGVFHSHHRHPAAFSRIDYEMHVQRFDSLWHMIVSVRNPSVPVVRVFAPSNGEVQEVPVHIMGEPAARVAPTTCGAQPAGDRDDLISRGRLFLKVDAAGRLRCRNASAVWIAIDRFLRLRESEVTADLLGEGFLRDAAVRYEEYVAPHMASVGATAFEMGRDESRPGGFHGECPQHTVELSSFEIGRVPVTEALYALFDPDRGDVPRSQRHRPVTNVSWAEAALFALWMGCRLPTEAEWEFACGAGSPDEWCCASMSELPRYAWYCKNSDGQVHPVGTREPNPLGFFDLHGNVWEWCLDSYDRDFYHRSPRRDPVSRVAAADGVSPDRVTRGGSMNAHAEMCRNRHRSYEPAHFHAGDLGFRLVKENPSGASLLPPW